MTSHHRQLEAWKSLEANAWYLRNKDKIPRTDPVRDVLHGNGRIPIPKSVLEIGCGNGRRLANLHKEYGCNVSGIDLSAEAIQDARILFPRIGRFITQKSADSLDFTNNTFDLVIFGFCLYCCDPALHFSIVREADRVLENKGFLIIHDFHTDFPHSRPYAHDRELQTYKMNWSKLFLAHPSYHLFCNRIMGSDTDHPVSQDDTVSVTVLRKNTDLAFPLKEWEA